MVHLWGSSSIKGKGARKVVSTRGWGGVCETLSSGYDVVTALMTLHCSLEVHKAGTQTDKYEVASWEKGVMLGESEMKESNL